jgi:hypothetical protein
VGRRERGLTPVAHQGHRAGALLDTFGKDGGAPLCPASVERIDAGAPDQPANMACAVDAGTPGWCNSVTPPAWCP